MSQPSRCFSLAPHYSFIALLAMGLYVGLSTQISAAEISLRQAINKALDQDPRL